MSDRLTHEELNDLACAVHWATGLEAQRVLVAMTLHRLLDHIALQEQQLAAAHAQLERVNHAVWQGVDALDWAWNAQHQALAVQVLEQTGMTDDAIRAYFQGDVL